MFPWQSNSSTRDNEHTTAEDDTPETPAHLFPVRAFKHAIFGTPAAPKTDRKPIRQRPQSSHDRPQCRDEDVLNRSPGKSGGILRTPGTGGKRKSVSFGGAGERTYEAAVGVHLGEKRLDGASLEPSTTASKPSEFARKLRGDTTDVAEEDVTMDMEAPRSVSGRYWKGEFDDYSSNTERQLKKLAKKEQVAKKYAQMRDGVALQLEEDLKRETARALELERKVEDFKRQLEAALKGTRHAATFEKDKELEQLRKENEKLKTQLRDQWHTQTEAKMSPVQTRSPERPHITRATTAPTDATPQTDRNPFPVPRQRPDSSRAAQAPLHRNSQQAYKEPSDIWADAAGSAPDTPGAALRATPRRRPRDREPLAQRTENVDSRSSSAAATLGTKAAVTLSAEERGEVSRSSSTAGTLGSKRQSVDAAPEQRHTQTDDAKRGTNEERKHKEMTSERQAAARKRLEERKRAKQRTAVPA